MTIMSKGIGTNTSANPPVVLSFSALDPSGAGGIQADIETAASLGCHCAPVVTSLCSSGNSPETDITSIDPTIIIEQARSVIDKMDVRAFKIGFLGSRANAEAIHSILLENEHLPIVSHPALCLADESNPEHVDIKQAYTNLILSLSNLAIFSLFEARLISQESDTIETTAHAIISSGCETTLITGTGKENLAFQNSAFNSKGLVKNYQWEQEAPACHGSSSTLAMSVASYLAHGFSDLQTLEQAQNFTWQSVHASRNLGFGKQTPHRFFWADKNIETSTEKLPGNKTH